MAPQSLHWEIGNAFSAMLKRRRITIEQAHAAITAYEQIALNLIDVDLAQAMEMAARLNIYAYDAYVIVCAANQNCPLMSLDHGLIHAAKAAEIDILEASSNADLS